MGALSQTSRSVARRFWRAAHRVRVIVYLGAQMVLILTGALIIATGGKIGSAIGASLIAAGASGILVFGWILYSESEAEKQRSIDEFGLVRAFPYRSIQIKDEYASRLNSARKNIDVMGFGLNALREDFLGNFKEWSDRAKVRILLVDPAVPCAEHTYVNLRDVEEHHRIGQTRDEIEAFIEDTRSLWTDAGTNFDLRLAKTLPSVNMFRVDNVAFWGPYLISSPGFGHSSRNLPTMIVRSPGYMFDRLVDHFDEIWNSSEFSRTP
jgi:hypothetical protein